MQEIILLKLGELVLKGLNRVSFENALIKSLKYRLRDFGSFEIKNIQSTIYFLPKQPIDLVQVCNKIEKIFGISRFCRAACAEKEIENIKETAKEYLSQTLNNAKTFKVESRRADKKFELKSPQISAEVGAFLLENFKHLTVDVHNPEVTVNIEIRDFGAYIFCESIKGAGGVPVGTSGKVLSLISGGIDSPVASFMMAKRGAELMAIHFASPPYTSPRAEQKVVNLLEKVSAYSGKIKMFTVPFTQIQTQIKKESPEEFFTIIMRRFMMKISEEIALQNGCEALITGESLGQVASQTLKAMAATDSVVSLPVFRPVIGMDKEEIIKIARKIDTFETSILPFEDCCTVFTPKHPKINPKIEKVKEAEKNLDRQALICQAIENTTFKIIDGINISPEKLNL